MEEIVFIKTPIGVLRISALEGFITELFFAKDAKVSFEKPKTSLMQTFSVQLSEYFLGTRKSFDVPFVTKGTAFQELVWEALCQIPYGQTRSYKQVAQMIGHPRAARAVGMANNKNPLPILIPCHRVIGANGKLVGYGGGLTLKEDLLELERATSS